MTHTDLIEKLSNSDGPCRDLDGEIMFRLHAKHVGRKEYLWPEDSPSLSFATKFHGKSLEWCKQGNDGERIAFLDDDNEPILMNQFRVPTLTASIDSALTLVPEGWEWCEGFCTRQMGDYVGQTHTIRRISDGFCATGFHKKPYHAICIASLRAIEAMEGE